MTVSQLITSLSSLTPDHANAEVLIENLASIDAAGSVTPVLLPALDEENPAEWAVVISATPGEQPGDSLDPAYAGTDAA